MLLEKALWIIAFTVVLLTSEVYGLDLPWNLRKGDVTCYTTCLAGIGTSTVVVIPFAVKIKYMIGVMKAEGLIAFLQSVGVTGNGTTNEMILCALKCENSEKIQGLDLPWNLRKGDVTCYTTCLAGIGTSTVVVIPFAVKIKYMIGVMKAEGLFAFLQSVGVTGNGTTNKMILCALKCENSEKIQDLKCNTHRINGMKGFDENVLKAEIVNKIEECEGLCNNTKECRAFRYLLKNRVCFVYNSKQHCEDDISESGFYVKRCVLCYMNITKNVKGRDDEIESVWEDVSSLEKCEDNCIKSGNCRAVHFDGERCFKFTDEVKPYEKTGIDFSRKICEQYTD